MLLALNTFESFQLLAAAAETVEEEKTEWRKTVTSSEFRDSFA